MSNCTKCHNFGDKTFREQCLNCHMEIRSRVNAKTGYHYTTRNIQCSACHKEHHGREFKLIRWDPSKFDHRQAGFALEGKHGSLDCKRCHTPENIKAKDISRKTVAMRSRTFLGLTTQCGNCHDDMHRGQLSQNCATCHTIDGWKPPSGFSHAGARFKLVGMHADVACGKCHPSKSDGKTIGGHASFLMFRGIRFGRCLDCHEDHHKGAFGEACDKCHSPAGWRSLKLNESNFNHAATRFTLTGAHAKIACERCHTGSNWSKFKGANLDACTTCHKDYHLGQFAERNDKGECSSCHRVESFTPASFEPAAHAKTRFPLGGSHAAIPCRDCHGQTVSIGGETTKRFRWEDFRCTRCHEDRHAGQFSAKIEKDGCESCHTVNGWKIASFDHDRTRFPLTGRHAQTDCRKCHVMAEINGRQTGRYTFATLACSSCHEDFHHGQLADAATGGTDCGRCHNPAGWRAVTFDHNTQSRFALTGKHVTIACSSCHPRVTEEGGKTTIRFKPLDTRCTYCHSDRKGE